MTMGPEPYYPYGTCLTLNQEQLEALGFTELPHAGESFTIEAKATVRRSSTEDPDADGDVDYACVELQITHLGLEGEDDKSRTARAKGKAAKLYGGDTDGDA
jgi:hypothetical protein